MHSQLYYCSQESENYFLGEEKKNPLYIKYKYTYSAYADIQYICGVKNSRGWGGARVVVAKKV